MAQYDLLLTQNVSAGVEYSEVFVNVAKGGLISAIANQTPTVLAGGTDGYVLVRDDAELTGLNWVDISTLGVSVANQANDRIVTSTASADDLNAEAQLTYNTSQGLLIGSGLGIVFTAAATTYQIYTPASAFTAGISIVTGTNSAAGAGDITLKAGDGIAAGGNVYFQRDTTFGNFYFGTGSAGQLPVRVAETLVVYYDSSSGQLSSGSPNAFTFPYEVEDASVDTNIEIAEFRRTTTGTAAAGIGGYLNISVEGADGSQSDLLIEHILVNAATSNENSVFQVQAQRTGNTVPILTMLGNTAYGAIDRHSIIIGHSINASGVYAVGIGVSGNPTGDNSVGLGYWARPTATYAIAIGSGAQAQSAGAVAIGYDTVASGGASIIMGYGSTPTNANVNSFKVMFNGTTVIHAGLLMGLRVMSDADPDTNLTTTADGTIAYDSTDHEFRAYVNGAWTGLTTGGSSPWSVAANVITPAVSGDDVRLAATEQLQFIDTTKYIVGPTGYIDVYNVGHVFRFAQLTGTHITYNDILAGGTGIDLGDTGGNPFNSVAADRYYVAVIGTYIDVSGTDMTFTSVAAGTVNLADIGTGSSDLAWSGSTADAVGTYGGSNTIVAEGSLLYTSTTGLFISASDGVIGQLRIEGGNNTVTAIGEINAQLLFNSNDGSVTSGTGGKIVSVTEATNGANCGMGFYTYSQSGDVLSEKFRITNAGVCGPKNHLELGSTSGNDLLQWSNDYDTISNHVYHRVWARRNSAGSDWTTASIHDAISVDSSFANPMTDTKTWWDRDPDAGVHIWGNTATEYFRATSSGVGIGGVNPSFRLDILGVGNTVLASLKSSSSAGVGGYLRLRNTNTGISTGASAGMIDFYKDDASTQGAGVVGSIAVKAIDAGGTYNMFFVTGQDVATPAGTNATMEYTYQGFLKVQTGTTTGSPRLELYQTTTRRSYIAHLDSGNELAIASEYGDIGFWTGASGTEARRMLIHQDGDISINATTAVTSGFRMELFGTDNKGRAADWTATSDVRLKTKITPYGSVLGGLVNLYKSEHGLSLYHRWVLDEDQKPTDKYYQEQELGLIAQEMKKIFPVIVNGSEDEYYDISYMRLAAIAAVGVGELKDEKDREILELKNRIETLENFVGYGNNNN